MMHHINILCFSLLWVFSFNTCHTSSKLHSGKNEAVVFLDSIESSTAIIKRDVEGFFTTIRPLDMSIQMKKQNPTDNKEVNLGIFKNFISGQVSDWTKEEKKIMTKTMEEVRRIVLRMNPEIMPTIALVKIKTNHYGDDVYYTRGNLICVPENIFDEYRQEVQLPIMIHEVFHIISKNHPVLRDSLYSLIGFEKLSSEPILPKALNDKLLTNPDGVTRQYAITLEDPETPNTFVRAIPLITSKRNNWEPTLPSFFDYLEFDLYPVFKEGNQWIAGADVLGKTTLPISVTPMFFTKIKDNTRYIIHPEEIMADNFMLAALAKEKNDYKKFSPQGKILIDRVTEIVAKFSVQR